MPTAFETAFAASPAKGLLAYHGEDVTYTPSGGAARTIKAIIDRNPPEPIPGVAGSLSRFAAATIAIGTTALSTTTDTDGFGCITLAELNVGKDTLTITERTGVGGNVARIIGRVLSQDGNMLTLEVR